MVKSDGTALVRFYDAPNPEAASQPTLYLKIEGVGKFAVMQYSSTFAKNEVPTATCVLATGTSVSGNTSTGIPEELAENLDGAELTKAEVFMRFGEGSRWEGSTTREWPTAEECIFEGYYAGLSYARVGPQVQMTINLVHQLVDLTFGSLMTGWQHPSNPANFLEPAVAPLVGGTGGDCVSADAGGTQGSWTVGTFMDTVSDGGSSDFGEAILMALLCMTSQDVFKTDCLGEKLPDHPNIAAAEVLKNMASKTGALRPPLDTDGFLSSIGYYLGAIIEDQNGLTYWDYLVGKVCPDFAMSVIPFPSKQSGPDKSYAYLAPDNPGLNTEYKTLYLEDYTNFNLKARMWKPLYAVGVMSAGDNLSGAECGANECEAEGGALCVGGVFPAPGSLERQLGQYLLIRQPEWLKHLNLNSGAVREFGDTGKGAHDAVDADSELKPDADKEPKALNKKRSEVLDMYAKMYYVHNAINGRGGTFDTKFRYDIAPGSILKLDKGLHPGAPQHSGTNTYKELPGTVYVQVSRVTHNVNAESAMAKTSFDCVHLRTEKENDAGQPEGRYSIDEHVFLKGAEGPYKGIYLIENWGICHGPCE